jgi:hypothetical protein
LAFQIRELLSKLWVGVEAWIPFGYQNATGFHLGSEVISSLIDLSSEIEANPVLP